MHAESFLEKCDLVEGAFIDSVVVSLTAEPGVSLCGFVVVVAAVVTTVEWEISAGSVGWVVSRVVVGCVVACVVGKKGLMKISFDTTDSTLWSLKGSCWQWVRKGEEEVGV